MANLQKKKNKWKFCCSLNSKSVEETLLDLRSIELDVHKTRVETKSCKLQSDRNVGMQLKKSKQKCQVQ